VTAVRDDLGGLAGAWAATTLGRLGRIVSSQGRAVEAAGGAVATALAAGHRVWVTQTSHTLHTELTRRAGGLIAVHPLEDLDAIEAGDVVLAGTTAGVFFDPIEAAIQGRGAGATVVALIQLAHEQDPALRVDHPSGRRLHEVADIVIDVGGRLGDGEVDLAGSDIAILPSSGVTGVFAAWLVLCVAVERLEAQGLRPLVYQSNLQDGARAGNEVRLERYAATRSGVEPLG
jgi:uncharacterized phosphosugar-binding protein